MSPRLHVGLTTSAQQQKTDDRTNWACQCVSFCGRNPKRVGLAFGFPSVHFFAPIKKGYPQKTCRAPQFGLRPPPEPRSILVQTLQTRADAAQLVVQALSACYGPRVEAQGPSTWGRGGEKHLGCFTHRPNDCVLGSWFERAAKAEWREQPPSQRQPHLGLGFWRCKTVGGAGVLDMGPAPPNSCFLDTEILDMGRTKQLLPGRGGF